MSTLRAPGRWRKVNGYRAFVPDSLPPPIAWSDTLVRALSDADRLVGRLAGEGGHLPNPHPVSYTHLTLPTICSV